MRNENRTKNVSIDRERRTEKRTGGHPRKSGRDTARMCPASTATEGRKIDGWAESKNFPLQSALGFPLVGTSHESQDAIFIRWTRAFPNFRRQIRRRRIIAVSSERTMHFFFFIRWLTPAGKRAVFTKLYERKLR